MAETQLQRHCKWTLVRHPRVLFIFIACEGIEPTNNHVERQIRHSVIWRKLSFAADSPKGSRFVERILTVVQSLRLQQRNVLEFVTAACEARLHQRPPPSLLPISG